jgi:hypothetical protein
MALGVHFVMGWDMLKKNPKVGAFATYFLQVLVDDKEAILT